MDGSVPWLSLPQCCFPQAWDISLACLMILPGIEAIFTLYKEAALGSGFRVRVWCLQRQEIRFILNCVRLSLHPLGLLMRAGTSYEEFIRGAHLPSQLAQVRR